MHEAFAVSELPNELNLRTMVVTLEDMRLNHVATDNRIVDAFFEKEFRGGFSAFESCEFFFVEVETEIDFVIHSITPIEIVSTSTVDFCGGPCPFQICTYNIQLFLFLVKCIL